MAVIVSLVARIIACDPADRVRLNSGGCQIIWT